MCEKVIPYIMVSNILLTKALEIFDNFRGCYSLDEIEEINPWEFHNVSSFVINTFEKKNTHGGHWVLASYWPDGGYIELFDSLGSTNPLPRQIHRLLSRYGRVTLTNPPIQHLLSDFCGFFVMGRLISIHNNQKLETFLSRFSKTDLEDNDLIIEENVVRYFRNRGGGQY